MRLCFPSLCKGLVLGLGRFLSRLLCNPSRGAWVTPGLASHKYLQLTQQVQQRCPYAQPQKALPLTTKWHPRQPDACTPLPSRGRSVPRARAKCSEDLRNRDNRKTKRNTMPDGASLRKYRWRCSTHLLSAGSSASCE